MNKTLSNPKTERARRTDSNDMVRLNGPAFVLALAVERIALIGGILLYNAGIGDDWLALYFIVSGLVALYFLFALKIARQMPWNLS